MDMGLGRSQSPGGFPAERPCFMSQAGLALVTHSSHSVLQTLERGLSEGLSGKESACPMQETWALS